MFAITQDIFEPQSIEQIMSSRLLVLRENCEPEGLADYFWFTGSQEYMWERKTGRELLACMWGRLDEQLTKYRDARPGAMVGIIQEGLISPMNGRCQVWRWKRGRRGGVMVPMETVDVEYSAYRGYMLQRYMEGTPLVVTLNQEDTALTLVSMVYNSMKAEHQGLRPKVIRKAKGEGLDLYTEHLMSIRGIGLARARALLDQFKTPWGIYSTQLDILALACGKATARSIYRTIGREE